MAFKKPIILYLNKEKIYAILIHNSKDLDDKKSKIILEHLESLKKI